MLRLAVGLLLSLGIGVSLGLIGGGGSIITLPVLVYVIGVDTYEAVAMSLAVVGSTAAISAAFHHRKGGVDWKAGALFAASGIPTSYLGSRLTYRVAPHTLLLLFAAIMLVVATAMLMRRDRPHEEPHARHPAQAVAAGLGVGFLTGFLGVGGGFLIVPALVFFGGLSMKRAVGTSLVVIAVNCAAGLAGHLGEEAPDAGRTLMVAGCAAVGALLGSTLSHASSPARLRRIFAVFVIGVALYLVARNLPLVMESPAFPS